MNFLKEYEKDPTLRTTIKKFKIFGITSVALYLSYITYNQLKVNFPKQLRKYRCYLKYIVVIYGIKSLCTPKNLTDLQ